MSKRADDTAYSRREQNARAIERDRREIADLLARSKERAEHIVKIEEAAIAQASVVRDAANGVRRAAADARRANENSDASKESAAEAAKARDDILATYEKITALLENKEAVDSALTDAQKEYVAAKEAHDLTEQLVTDAAKVDLVSAFSRDDARMAKVEKWHWVGVVLVVAALSAIFGWALYTENLVSVVGFSFPFVLILFMIGRSLSEHRMIHAEYEHKHRMALAAVGVKRFYAGKGEDEFWDKLLEALEQNPARRLRVSSDTLWSVLREFIKNRRSDDEGEPQEEAKATGQGVSSRAHQRTPSAEVASQSGET